MEVDEQTLALIISGEQDGSYWGDNDLHRVLGVLVGERRSLRLLEIHNRGAVAHGRRTLFHRIAFPPLYGASSSFLTCNSRLSLYLSQVNQSQWDFVGLSEPKACFVGVS